MKVGRWHENIGPGLVIRTFAENVFLRKITLRDPLTRLMNRRAFNEVFDKILAGALRHRRPLCVAMIDVDHFKKVNDTYGHPAADMVLRRLAEIFQGSLRANDIVARYGGEEFRMILDLTPTGGGKITKGKVKESAEKPLERIREKIEKAGVNVKGGKIKITVSIGFAVYYPTSHASIFSPKEQALIRDRLITGSDAALYLAKQGGRNRICGED